MGRWPWSIEELRLAYAKQTLGLAEATPVLNHMTHRENAQMIQVTVPSMNLGKETYRQPFNDNYYSKFVYNNVLVECTLFKVTLGS